MKFEISGIIKHVSPAETLQTAAGQKYTRRVIMVETTDPHPQSMAIELINENATTFVGRVGQRGHFSLNFLARRTATGQYFTNVRAWRYILEAV